MLKKNFILSALCLACITCAFADETVYVKDCNIESKSIKYYKNKINENMQDICSLYNLYIAYAKKNDPSNELLFLHIISAFNPKDTDVYASSALIYDTYNNREGYYREYARAIKNVPDYAKGHEIVSEAYRNILDYEKALEHINTAIKLTKEPDESFLRTRANIYEDMKKYEEAINDYKKLIEINPSYYFYHTCMASCYMNMGRYNDAIEELTKALELEPSEYSSYKYRSICYKKLGKMQEAKDDEEMYLKLSNTKKLSKSISEGLSSIKEKLRYKKVVYLLLY